MRELTLALLLACWVTNVMADGVSDASAGAVAFEQGNYKEAERLFTVAIQLNQLSPPDTESAYFELAKTLAAEKELAESLADLKHALSLGPDDKEALIFEIGLGSDDCKVPTLGAAGSDAQSDAVLLNGYQQCIAEVAGQLAMDGKLGSFEQNLMFAKIDASGHLRGMIEKMN